VKAAGPGEAIVTDEPGWEKFVAEGPSHHAEDLKVVYFSRGYVYITGDPGYLAEIFQWMLAKGAQPTEFSGEGSQDAGDPGETE
jgi:hypothetical protein